MYNATIDNIYFANNLTNRQGDTDPYLTKACTSVQSGSGKYTTLETPTRKVSVHSYISELSLIVAA